MQGCIRCGGGYKLTGENRIKCSRCDFFVEGRDQWDALYQWNCLNPSKTPEQRLEEEYFSQDESEFQFLLDHVQGNSLLEIGSRYGESFRRLSEKLPIGSRVVTLDLGQDPYSPNVDTQTYRARNCERLSKMGYDVHLLTGDSHSPDIVERVRSLGPFDVVFIDGDHSIKGVTEDWNNYGPMGKIVAFHDINGFNQMRDFWRDLPGKKKDRVNSTMGIGIVFRESTA